jgi:hypothetical protein
MSGWLAAGVWFLWLVVLHVQGFEEEGVEVGEFVDSF